MNNGRILKQIKPTDSTKELKGKIWTKIVDKVKSMNNKTLNILSTSFNPDNSINIRIYSE